MTKPRQKWKKSVFSILKRMRPPQIIVLMFAAIILLGMLLLMLPIASRDGNSAGAGKALFTATSATCVTGLVMADTWTQWSGFGQSVILVLIQIGGLGFMSVFSIFVLLLNKRFSMKNRLLLSQSMGVDSLSGVVRLMRHAIVGTALIEFCGAFVLTLRFLQDFGFWRSLRLGVFHAVSAFCNAGFDILGFLEPGASLAHYGSDVIVMVTLMLLITIGGLGFFVWEDILCYRKSRHLTLYTKLVLGMTAVLIVGGAAVFALLEWKNPNTIANLPVEQKMLSSFFQSVSLRTAGFDALGQGGLTQSGKALSVVLMLIGGSSGSTAGGLKTVTFGIILLAAISTARGNHNLTVCRRTVGQRQIHNAYALAVMMVALTFFGGMFISATGNFTFIDAVYEAVSALATVGLSTGITAQLARSAKVLIILYMFFGRVGIMTIVFGFMMNRKKDEYYRYAETNLLIG